MTSGGFIFVLSGIWTAIAANSFLHKVAPNAEEEGYWLVGSFLCVLWGIGCHIRAKEK